MAHRMFLLNSKRDFNLVRRLSRCLLFIGLSLLLVTIAGCNQAGERAKQIDNKIVGLWKDSVQVWEFDPDGTFRMDDLDVQSDGATGTWELDDGSLKLLFKRTGDKEPSVISVQFEDDGNTLIFVDADRRFAKDAN